jgi:hypothetical protein
MYHGKKHGKNCTIRYDKLERHSKNDRAQNTVSDIEK